MQSVQIRPYRDRTDLSLWVTVLVHGNHYGSHGSRQKERILVLKLKPQSVLTISQHRSLARCQYSLITYVHSLAQSSHPVPGSMIPVTICSLRSQIRSTHNHSCPIYFYFQLSPCQADPQSSSAQTQPRPLFQPASAAQRSEVPHAAQAAVPASLREA